MASLTTYGQNVGYQVDVDNITYAITSTAPTEVEVAGYTGTTKEVTILATVNHDGTGYDMTAIGERAFDNVVLTEWCH